MKFVCKKCEGDPCVLQVPKSVKWERDDWEKALRRCPFESTTNNKLTGKIPLAKWQRTKGGEHR